MKQKNLPKKKLPLLAAVFALVLLLSACAGEASPSYQTITPEEGAKLMGEGGVTVVDLSLIHIYSRYFLQSYAMFQHHPLQYCYVILNDFLLLHSGGIPFVSAGIATLDRR